MLSQTQVESFQTKGFLLGGKVLNDEQVEVLRQELACVIEEQGSSKPQPVRIANLSRNPENPVWQIVNIWEASRAFQQLIYHPQIVEEVAQLTEALELRVWHDQIQYKPAEKGGVNMWHQDSPYWPILTPKTSQTTAWVALDDADESNGCMRMVPGSHLWGNQIQVLHTLKSIDEMVSTFENRPVEASRCPVPKGYVHYHHSLTWHGSHANSSGRPRRAIAIHYMTEKTLYDQSGNHLMKPFVEAKIADGQKLEGEHFPLVFADGKPVKT